MTTPASLRVASLNNNLAWLESFGCRVRKFGDVTAVDFPPIPDYCAILVTRASNEAGPYLQRAIDEATSTAISPIIYVDRTVSIRPLSLVLRNHGYCRALTSTIWSGVLAKREIHTPIKVARAEQGESAAWARLYSEGFARHGPEALVDQTRWNKAFRSPLLTHWFIQQNGQRIGVCQTCEANEIVGIYSFTILPMYRGHGIFVAALASFEAELTSTGPKTVYFERTGGGDGNLPTRSSPTRGGFQLLREFDGYKRSSGKPPDIAAAGG